MEKQNIKSENNLKYRAYKFSLDTIDLLEILPKNYIFEIIGKQLLRSATSIAANIIEAQGCASKKDFINFFHIALKSSTETKFWLSILNEKLRDEKAKMKTKKCLGEAIQISKMIGASLLTLKGKRF
jgi:four helix bundle protein